MQEKNERKERKEKKERERKEKGKKKNKKKNTKPKTGGDCMKVVETSPIGQRCGVHYDRCSVCLVILGAIDGLGEDNLRPKKNWRKKGYYRLAGFGLA